jgi:lipoprotein-releasing system permease protein
MARNSSAFSSFEWMVAGRYLRARRQESFISVISGFSLVGIALGVATLIIVMSVMNGFRAELLGRILGLNGHMIVQSVAGSIPGYDALVARMQQIPGVTSATPFIEGQVLVNSEGQSMGALVRGLEPGDLKRLTAVSSSIEPKVLASFGTEEEDSVVLGSRLAERLGLAPGMNVTLVSPNGDATPFGSTPRIKTYRIAGTFRIGMSEYDQTYIFMPLKEAQLFFGLGDSVQGIEVMVAKPDDVAAWRTSIQRVAGPSARLVDWQQMNSSLFGALGVERNVMFLILTLIILVAALNIISGLIMLVKDKGGDIAILRTMGASKGAVMRVFFIAGAFIGTTGTLLGVLIGVVFCANIETIRQFLSRVTGTTLFDPTIYFLSQMPAKIDPYDIIAVIAMALSLSFLATLYPSWRAARLDPVEALRYE